MSLRERYIPPYKPRPKKLNPALPTTNVSPPAVTPEVVSRLPTSPVIDLDAFAHELMTARPSEALPIIGRWRERSRLKGGSERAQLHLDLFAKLRSIYTEAAALTATRAAVQLKVQAAIRETQEEIDLNAKRRVAEHAELDARIAQAVREKRRAENKDDD